MNNVIPLRESDDIRVLVPFPVLDEEWLLTAILNSMGLLKHKFGISGECSYLKISFVSCLLLADRLTYVVFKEAPPFHPNVQTTARCRLRVPFCPSAKT